MNGLVGYFGYGSLVNVETLDSDFVSAHPARLKGWRRNWQSRGRDVAPGTALLSVHRHEETAIDGLLVIDRAENLPAIDQRELRYDRVRLTVEDIDFAGPKDGHPKALPDTLHVYVGRPQPPEPVEPPLLQSYLDTVMAGFLDQHDHDGVHRFVETTAGFDRSMRLDRAEPIYSRSVDVGEHLHAWFDEVLEGAGVKFGEE